MDAPAIEASGLGKTWRTPGGVEARALECVTLTVPRGTCFGLIGPAGSGKTTFAGIAAGRARPDRGAIRVCGKPAAAARARLCPVAGSSQLLLEFLRQTVLQAASRLRASGAIRTLHALRLLPARLQFPNLLILDDPGNLDRAMLTEARRLMLDLTGRGVTILVCSRPGGNVARLCSYVALLRAGKVVACGRAEQLLGPRGFRLTARDLPERLQAVLADDGMTIGFNGASYWIESADRARLNDLIDRIRDAGGSIEGLEDLPAL